MCKKFIRTDPIARKNENVAALLSMYCERVARKPRWPAPPLRLYGCVSADNGNEGGERGGSRVRTAGYYSCQI
jgi:hypothetical protein